MTVSLGEPPSESLSGSLAGRRRREEDLLQDVVPAVRRVLDALRQAWFLQVHDVLAASRRGSDEDHPAEDRRPVLHHLKRNHPTEGVPEDVTRPDSKRLEKCSCMFRHSGDGRRDLAGRAPHAGVVEQDDLPSRGERVGHRGIPVVERPGEVLQEEER
jgi:hypothetical protein